MSLYSYKKNCCKISPEWFLYIRFNSFEIASILTLVMKTSMLHIPGIQSRQTQKWINTLSTDVHFYLTHNHVVMLTLSDMWLVTELLIHTLLVTSLVLQHHPFKTYELYLILATLLCLHFTCISDLILWICNNTSQYTERCNYISISCIHICLVHILTWR